MSDDKWFGSDELEKFLTDWEKFVDNMQKNWNPCKEITREMTTDGKTIFIDEQKQAKCECDIHQLMRGDGHDKVCPEKQTRKV